MFKQWSKTKIAIAVIGVAAIFALPVLVQAKSDDDTVVATVNGNKILKKDVMSALKSIQVKSADVEKAFPLVVDQMINEKLIDEATAKANIEQDAEFQQRMAAAKEQMIKTMYLERALKDKVNDKTVKAAYDKFRADNKGKQEVHARHILVKSEEEAKQVIKDLDNGAKFETLAKERSSGPTAQNGGDVGWFAKGELIPEFSSAAFDLKPGTYTKEPVKSQFGYHVIMVEGKRERTVPELKDVEDSIRQKLGQDAVQQLVIGLRQNAQIERFDMNGKPLATETKKN